MVDFEALAQDAKPINDDDYASERQLAAENLFFDELKKAYPVTFGDDSNFSYEAVVYKMTTDEYIEHAMRLVREGLAS